MNIEDLKCCGNCTHRVSNDMGSCVEEGCDKGIISASYEICPGWEYDNLTREKREN